MSSIEPEISLHPEQAESGTGGKDGSSTLKYRAINCDFRSQAIELFLGVRPVFNDGFPYLNYSYDEVGFGVWDITANYGFDDRESSNPNDPVVSFDTTGSSYRMTYALDTVAIGKSPDAMIPDFQNGINWDGEKYNGVDVEGTGFKWTEKYDKPYNFINRSYRRMMRNMTGTVNDRAFRDFAAGEVRFLGCQAQSGRSEDNSKIWEVRYSFVAEPNIGGLQYGDCEPVDKEGHDYVWPYTELIEDEENKRTVRKLRAVVVNRIFRRSNFANLGIGVD